MTEMNQGDSCDFCACRLAKPFTKGSTVRRMCPAHVSAWLDGFLNPWKDEKGPDTPVGTEPEAPEPCARAGCDQPATFWVSWGTGFCQDHIPSDTWRKRPKG